MNAGHFSMARASLLSDSLQVVETPLEVLPRHDIQNSFMMNRTMKPSDTRLIRLIALFKVLKAILLIAVAIAAFKLVHTNITDALTQKVARLGLDPGGRYVGRAILKTVTLTPNKIKDVGVGSLIYAGLFLTEGIGLWLVKRWAEWFSVIITSSLLPVEVYEIHRHPTVFKVLALLINLAVVGYLLYRIRTEHRNA